MDSQIWMYIGSASKSNLSDPMDEEGQHEN